MPKDRKRTTADPLGQKLLAVLADQGHADDLNYLAAQFDVRVQSVYDWINFGRLSKDRYARLVAWSGRDLHWWFDIAPPVNGLQARETAAAYRTTRYQWPFERIPIDLIGSLPSNDLLRVEGAVLLTLAQLGAAQPSSKQAA